MDKSVKELANYMSAANSIEEPDEATISCILLSHKQSIHRWISHARFDAKAYCRNPIYAY